MDILIGVMYGLLLLLVMELFVAWLGRSRLRKHWNEAWQKIEEKERKK